MEMIINIFGIGVTIPKTGFGLNVASGSYIGFRHAKHQPDKLLGLRDIVSLGSKSGTLVGSWVATDWFVIDVAKHSWAVNTNSLVGKKAENEVIGTLVIHGTVDLKFTVFDQNGNASELLTKADIKAAGGQISNTKVRGVLGKVK
jgi:hypothetical protein